MLSMLCMLCTAKHFLTVPSSNFFRAKEKLENYQVTITVSVIENQPNILYTYRKALIKRPIPSNKRPP